MNKGGKKREKKVKITGIILESQIEEMIDIGRLRYRSMLVA